MRSLSLLLTLLLGLSLVLAACAPPRMTPPAHPESVLAPEGTIVPEEPGEVDAEADVPIMEAEVDDSEAIDGEEDDDGRR
jgi:hypothetical protein